MMASYEVRFCNDHKGVGLYATKDIKGGDVIFAEKPLVCSQFAWNETYGYLACHHCLRPLESAEENIRRLTNNTSIVLPFAELCPTDKSSHRYCEQCGVGYCSEECKQLAWDTYHDYLCFQTHPGLKNLYETWKKMHYPPEEVSIMLMARIISTIEKVPDKERAIATFLEFSHGTSKGDDISLKFVGKEFSENFQQLRLLLLESLPIHYADRFVSEEGLKTLFALVGRNSQGIGTSPFSVWVERVENHRMTSKEREDVNKLIDLIYTQMDEYVGNFLNSEGSGLYKLERCMNHSCMPNTKIMFPNGDYTLAVVAERDIAADEEICVSYLNSCQLERSRHSRNKYLREYYLFECQCEKCIEQADDPDVTSEEEDEDSDMEE